MCRKCDAEREYLIAIEDAALMCQNQHGTFRPLIIALLMEETDQDIAKHLSFLYLDTADEDESVEETLIGIVYLRVLELKARLQ